MTLILDLPEELEARVRAEADARGTDTQTVLQDLVRTLPPIEPEPFRKFGTAEEEAADEAAWATSFARSHDMLARMAQEAAEEDRKGLTVPLDTILAE